MRRTRSAMLVRSRAICGALATINITCTVDTVEKSVAATETPRCTVPYSGVERAGGEYAGAVEWPSAALSPECALGYLLRSRR
jgi:hypothetical protein